MKRISLTGKHGKGMFAIVDNEDYEWLTLFRWHLDKSGYATTALKRGEKVIRMHRVLLAPDDNEEVDHINGNRLDNRKENLRTCTRQQNCFNRAKMVGDLKLSSKFKGVSFYKRNSSWSAYIHINRKKIHIGYFPSETEAAIAYDNQARKLFGEFAKLNLPVAN